MSSSGTTKTEELRAELVIIGGGGGGLPAAVAAAEKGVSNVVVLEKRHAPGGNAVFAGGPRRRHAALESAESQWQRSLGIDARRDDFFKKAMEWSHWRMNARLVRALIDKSGDTIRWLGKEGVKFEMMGRLILNQPSPNQPPMGFAIGPGAYGSAVVKALVKKCKELGVQILCDTRAKKLLTSKEGRVIGVLAEAKDKELRISAKSVIIATGGFLGNKELMKQYFHSYNDDLYDDMYLTGLPHTGDGLLMAAEIGAATNGTVAFEWEGHRFPWLPISSSLSYFSDHHDPIWVNKKGERFAAESTLDATNSLYQQPHKTFYTIFDEKIKQALYKEEGNLMRERIVPAKADEEFRLQADKGRVKISDSWDEIAKWIGAVPEVLKATIDEYNSFCDKGHDALFLKDPRHLVPLRTPPYYAIKCCLNMLLTRGPLKVNHHMEVLDNQDNPIPGLYAAGVDIGGTDSDTYWGTGPGHSFGFAITSGRIAGENAAKFIEGK